MSNRILTTSSFCRIYRLLNRELISQCKLTKRSNSSSRRLFFCARATRKCDLVQSNIYTSSCLKCSVNCENENVKELQVGCYHGWPTIIIPLPSRGEICRFILRPISQTIQDFYDSIKNEDNGVEEVNCFTLNGHTVDENLSLHKILAQDFKLEINKKEYVVKCPKIPDLTDQDIKTLTLLTASISRMFESLNSEEFDIIKKQKLISRYESLQMQLLPLEEQREKLDRSAERHVRRLAWIGLFYMAFQTGIFARMTWWEFSWDIMEPITYFTGYLTTTAAFSYFVLTKDRYKPDIVADRFHLQSFYRQAKNSSFDYQKYNRLKDEMAAVKLALQRLKDPMKFSKIKTIIFDEKKQLMQIKNANCVNSVEK